MKKRDIWLLLSVVGAACILLLTAGRAWKTGGGTDGMGTAEGPLYMRVTVGGVTFDPFVLEEEKDFSIQQGETMLNIVSLSPEGFHMAYSTCNNQDCVLQGEVTPENMRARLLGNAVVCLPNQVVVELLRPEEVAGDMEG